MKDKILYWLYYRKDLPAPTGTTTLSCSHMSFAMVHVNPLSGFSLWSGGCSGCIQRRESLYQCVQRLFLWLLHMFNWRTSFETQNMPLRNRSRSPSGILVCSLVEAWHRFKCWNTSLVNKETLSIKPPHVLCSVWPSKVTDNSRAAWAPVRSSHISLH